MSNEAHNADELISELLLLMKEVVQRPPRGLDAGSNLVCAFCGNFCAYVTPGFNAPGEHKPTCLFKRIEKVVQASGI